MTWGTSPQQHAWVVTRLGVNGFRWPGRARVLASTAGVTCGLSFAPRGFGRSGSGVTAATAGSLANGQDAPGSVAMAAVILLTWVRPGSTALLRHLFRACRTGTSPRGIDHRHNSIDSQTSEAAELPVVHFALAARISARLSCRGGDARKREVHFQPANDLTANR